MELDQEFFDGLLGAMPVGDIPVTKAEYAATLGEALAEIATPNLTVEMVAADGGFRTEYVGIDGYVSAWADWLEPFESYHVDLEDVRVEGEMLLVLSRQRVTPKGTASTIESDAAAVIWVKDKRITRIEFHLDRASAFRAAGLEDQSAQE
jgi:ketosteroid isomerase-like protein